MESDIKQVIGKRVEEIATLIESTNFNSQETHTLYLYALTCLLLQSGKDVVEFYGMISLLQNNFEHILNLREIN